jgi:hypothetical protein
MVQPNKALHTDGCYAAAGELQRSRGATLRSALARTACEL